MAISARIIHTFDVIRGALLMDNAMTYDELLERLLIGLLNELPPNRRTPLPIERPARRDLLRALMNTRPPNPIHPEQLQ